MTVHECRQTGEPSVQWQKRLRKRIQFLFQNIDTWDTCQHPRQHDAILWYILPNVHGILIELKE